MALSELEEAFFTQDDTIVVEPPADDAPTPTADDVPKDDTPPAPTPTDDTPAPVVEYIPPYKGKKYIQVDDEAALYDILDKKYRPTKMSADEKALAFIKQQNPELDDDEIAFTAATKYGIGVQPLSDEELTDEQKIAGIQLQV